MASFLTSLWESIFTPGPTPTLLIATNATFAALQLLLLILLIATYSVHFLVLSILSGGLWYAINWFAAELAAAKASDAVSSDNKPGSAGDGKTRGARGKSPEQGSDTETEHEPNIDVPPPVTTAVSSGGQGLERRNVPSKPMPPPPAPAQGVPKPTGSPGLLEPKVMGSASVDGGALGRRRSLGESGYISTDSEWEKVSEGEGKK